MPEYACLTSIADRKLLKPTTPHVYLKAWQCWAPKPYTRNLRYKPGFRLSFPSFEPWFLSVAGLGIRALNSFGGGRHLAYHSWVAIKELKCSYHIMGF